MSQPASAPPAGETTATGLDPSATAEVSTQQSRQRYTVPTLTDLGSVQEVTRGTFASVGADNGIYS